MYKLIISTLLLTSINTFGSTVLLSYFEPFSGKSANNSKTIVSLISKNLRSRGFDVNTCELRTVYDKAHDDLLNCIGQSKDEPDIIISFGEGPCNGLRIETRAVNKNDGLTLDNDGIQYNNQSIYPNEAESLGVSLPVEKAYCSLSQEQKKSTYISHDTGSFVCNNTLYHSLRNIQIPTTFFHVPQKSCFKRSRRGSRKTSSLFSNQVVSQVATDMIKKLVEITKDAKYITQPNSIQAVKDKLKQPLNSCERSFYATLEREY